MTKLGLILATMALVVAAAGCGGSQKGGVSKDDCMAAATSMGNVFKAQAAGEPGMEPMVAEMQAVFADHCVADKWSSKAVACITKATDPATLDLCQSEITQAQQDALKADMEKRLEGMAPNAGSASGGGDLEGGGGGGGNPCGDGADPCGGGE